MRKDWAGRGQGRGTQVLAPPATSFLHALRSRTHPPAPLSSPLSSPSRRNLFDYDQVVNTQRDKIYAERRKALLAPDLAQMMREYAEKTADDILEVRREGWGAAGDAVCCCDCDVT